MNLDRKIPEVTDKQIKIIIASAITFIVVATVILFTVWMC